ncbi:MAG: SpoIIE family protein phosphatase [Bacteroidetes bacterium]|nr:SpoIIE family protein phosphatase [Bacteroidota bacterium]MBU1720781.1 SpoIIE family protein phosphatase [Bacteroidota bacterium]
MKVRQIGDRFYNLLLAIIIVASMAILISMLVDLSGTVENLARDIIEETDNKVNKELDAYFNPIKADLLTLKDQADNDLFGSQSFSEINPYVYPVLFRNTRIKTFAIADEKSTESSLISEDSAWLNNLVYRNQETGQLDISRERWTGDLLERSIVRQWIDSNSTYNPSQRDWFKGGVNLNYPDSLFWTAPYHVTFQEIPGITVSTFSANSKSAGRCVLQFDIFLDEISSYTRNMKVGKTGKIFILTDELKVVGLPASSVFEQKDTIIKYLLAPADQLPVRGIAEAVNQWKETPDDMVSAFSFSADGKSWWGHIGKYRLGESRYFLIGIIIPESDFLADIKASRDFIVVGFLTIFIFILFVVRAFRQKQKANVILKQQKELIEEQKAEIEAQRDMVVEQKDQIEIQAADLQVKNKNITDSISYASRIQSAILPGPTRRSLRLPDSFVFFRPKDIVSGDFYWIEKFGDKTFVAAVDCTGHGVPGAFMSMIGQAALNQALHENHITEPHKILNFLSQKIYDTLQRNSAAHSVKDGMDLTICSFAEGSGEIAFAGVRNPAYIVHNGEIRVFKGDSHPIGEPFDEEFSSYRQEKFQIEKESCVYMLSDGYIDQFGGPSRKKFLAKRFRELIVEIAHLPLQEQEERLASEFINWKRMIEQYDDVMVIGFRM